jgi:hypothetical protein
MARKLRRIFEEYWGENLVDERREDAFLAAWGRHPKLASVPWYRVNSCWRLLTPYGMLRIAPDMGKCRTITRKGSDLVNCSTGRPVAFRSIAGAKIAALFHLPQGFGDRPSAQWGCRWAVPHLPAPVTNSSNSSSAAVDDELPEDFEFTREDLDQQLYDFCGFRSAADALLLEQLQAQPQTWIIRQPTWTRISPGQHELMTPGGKLTVQRFLAGWIVRRDNAVLVWCLLGKRPVVFCALADAKLAGLVHAHDFGCSGFFDGTKWHAPV